MIIPPGPEPVSSIGLAAGGEAYPPTETPPQAEIYSTAAGIHPSPPKSPWDMIESHNVELVLVADLHYTHWGLAAVQS